MNPIRPVVEPFIGGELGARSFLPRLSPMETGGNPLPIHSGPVGDPLMVPGRSMISSPAFVCVSPRVVERGGGTRGGEASHLASKRRETGPHPWWCKMVPFGPHQRSRLTGRAGVGSSDPGRRCFHQDPGRFRETTRPFVTCPVATSTSGFLTATGLGVFLLLAFQVWIKLVAGNRILRPAE